MRSSIRPVDGLFIACASVVLAWAPGSRARTGGGPAPKPLVVCAVPSAMPRTGRAADGSAQGLDVAVVRLVARRLGRPVEFHWCASVACGWNCLPEGRCDVVAGQPLDTGPPHGVAWSVPYAGARFGLVVARGGAGARSLDDLRGRRVGMVAGTVPLSDKDHTVVRARSREELLDRFADLTLDAALIDADFAAWYLHDHPGLALRLVDGFAPRERWNMALAVRASDGDLVIALNRALAQTAESGELGDAYRSLGVTFHSPFAASARRGPASDAWERVAARKELVVGMDPANLPYSSARDDPPGLDLELARAAADRLGVALRVDWLDTRRESAVGHLLERRCDLVFGEAVDANAVAGDEALAGRVLYSRPYYTTGYVLVRRKGDAAVRSLADLAGERSQRLGAEAGSVADYRLRRRGFLRQLFRNQLAALKAVDDRRIDAAYLWANARWTLHATPEFPLEVVTPEGADDRWDVAAAMNSGGLGLKQRVDAALDALAADGTVARLLAKYHLPAFPAERGDAKGVIRHRPVDRGPEPTMERVQTSRNGYTGLARVRSAGELVVGLDQNNLPFSTAHPSPAGLDVDVAGLLAERLGFSLRIYWAYSSHDSYPSKLAARRLCDVILGVTPDDRFAQRVLYSRPYYQAAYRTVVRAGEGPPAAGEPVGVEAGVAVRSLAGRAVRPYPSTEAVLEAVAAGRVRAGYVVSTRGPWLAHERWPGVLTFLPSGPDAEVFPVCAAVRKGDRDLNEAIARTWVELERSGRLAAVFARWHVPYAPAAARRPESRETP